MTDQTPYWIALSRVPGVGPSRMRGLLNYFGDAESAWTAMYGDLASSGLDSRTAEALMALRRTFDIEREMERLDKAGVRALTWESDDYPEHLRQVENGPPVLYMLGSLSDADVWAVGVVGTRRATAYGREVASRLSGELAQGGVTIVSGLARGVDTLAHHAALDAGGRTVAVLGSGLDVIYPPENRALVRRIVEEDRGAVLSEYPLGTQPDAVNFPPRNRIISGMSKGVLVVEAGEKSGALITVTFALEQGRDVFAVPGPITSRLSDGTNNLIKQGAKCVTSARDILEELNMDTVSEHVEAARVLPSEPTERLILGFLQDASQHIDEITNRTGLPASTVSAILTMMELKGMVRHVGGMQYAAR